MKVPGRAPALLFAVTLAVLAVLGAMSVNYGAHWDEMNITRSVRRSYETGLFLPHWYNYPSVAYDLSTLAALPRVATGGPAALGVTDSVLASPERAAHASSAAFTLELRAVFFVVTLLTGLAVFLLVARLSGSGWTALFGALALVGSWEFFYQARWIAPDGLVLLFVAFSLWAQHRTMDPGAGRAPGGWLLAAAVFAGLAAGAKYPGTLVWLPLVLAAWWAPARRTSGRFRRVVLALLVATAVFLATTPGLLFEHANFVHDVQHEMEHYRTGHGGHTVGAGWDAFAKLATYLGLVFFSENRVLAVVGTLFTIAGVVDLARTGGRRAVWLLSFPVVAIAYFSGQRVMIVRNDLFLGASLATLAALGARTLWRAAGERRLARAAIIGAAVLLVGFDLGFAVHSAVSLARPEPPSRPAALAARLASASGTRFALSPGAQALLDSMPAFHATNVVGSMDSADRFVFVSSEVSDWQQFAANKPGRYRTIWKRAEDVDWDYYPTWTVPRVLEVSAAALRHDRH